LSDLRTTIVLDRSRRKFARKIKAANCKYNEFTIAPEFRVQKQRRYAANDRK
jgi:hypothetical protein